MKNWFSRLGKPRQPNKVTSPPRLFPDGHFYSPLADLDDILGRQEAIWRSAKDMAGIDWQENGQLSLLPEFGRYVPEIDFPVEKPGNPATYFYNNISSLHLFARQTCSPRWL